jgi:cytochrome c556
MNRFSSFGLLTVIGLAVSAALAQELTQEQARNAAETRQSIFKLLAWNMDPMAGMLRNERPFDADVVGRNAERIAQLGQMIPDAFERDTRGFGLETQARDAIWGNIGDFGQKAEALVAAASQLRSAAETGDRAPVARAIGAMGQACGACHDAYRTD